MEGITPQDYIQRAKGQISFNMNGSRIEKLYQSGCSKLLLPKTYGEMKEAVMLNTAGGVTGGDMIDVKINASDCNLAVTSQTAERFYQSNMHPALISIDLKIDKQTNFHWLPQETIIFEGAAVDRKITLNMSSDSHCLLAETIVLGREAMGENIQQCHFTDQWRLYIDGKLFHSESIRMIGDVEKLLHSNASANGARMISTIICAGPNTDKLKPIVEKNLASMNSNCACSFFNKKMIIRLLSLNSASGRAELNQMLIALRKQPMPRVWQQ